MLNTKLHRHPPGAWKYMAANMKVGDFKKFDNRYAANALALALTRIKCRTSILKYDMFYYVIRMNRL